MNANRPSLNPRLFPRPPSIESGTTVDPDEIARFTALAAEWWDPNGKCRPLHRLNPVRLRYIRDHLTRHFPGIGTETRPLAGLRLIDVGCGGGLIAEPLARMGATVVGIDAAAANVRVAAQHAADAGVAIDYRCTTAEAVAASDERFDVVVALEIVEHVADLPLFLTALATMTKPEGMIILATVNRTAKSFALAIVGAEYLLRWLPRGTHEWRRFRRPSELAGLLRRHGFAVGDVTGVGYNPLRDEFRLTDRDLDVNYLLTARRGP
ncbi:MAG: bifunctional 2-polyprenyl-6-hydroxyphenol methylase/3-demethylubiquinol 3-O-methyltransferase UbiG [Azospirillaceae bacterium]|nr:bifunctional 2-polyprenyl-6-hydroxyphenol methylase/3-demethylubiquinol 3-O-methyltransferase UbiG [Azospirillaceae bacterium]